VQRNGHFGKKASWRSGFIDTPNGPVRLSGQANDEGYQRDDHRSRR
jgi:hypothetical protein